MQVFGPTGALTNSSSGSSLFHEVRLSMPPVRATPEVSRRPVTQVREVFDNAGSYVRVAP